MADVINVEGPLGEDLFDTEGAEEERRMRKVYCNQKVSVILDTVDSA